MTEKPIEITSATPPAIVRLGDHAIELGKAAEEIGVPSLIEAVRIALIKVGIAIARLTK